MLAFLFGVLCGVVVSAALAFYGILQISSKDAESTVSTSSTVTLREGEPSPEEKQSLIDAISLLQGADAKKSEMSSSAEVFPSEECSGTAKDMDKSFQDASKDAKERYKHIKALCSFVGDFGRAQAYAAKEYHKLSKVAESYVKADNDQYLDKWWNSLSIAMDHMSQDYDYMSSEILNNIARTLSRVEQEHGHLEKKLTAEGSKLLQRLRDAQYQYDNRVRETEKLREKSGMPNYAAQASAGSSNNESSSSSAAAPNSANTVTFKAAMKIQQSEAVQQEYADKLAVAQQELNEKLPRILEDYALMARNSASSMMETLLKFTNLMGDAQTKSSVVTHRLRMDLAASAASASIDRSLLSYTPEVLQLLEQIAQGKQEQMDMTSESSAALAASLLSLLPKLPKQFLGSIGKETCVWFNAFSGRMYRDAARSEYFNDWFCRKVGNMLNKGKRPDFLDPFSVEGVKFGSSPPLLRNMQWIPVVDGATHQDAEYDIACTADMTFRTGISFTVKTRVWLNWPRDKYAFIPVSIDLEIAEMSGKIRFGVCKKNSFFSFLEEPFTRFKVNSELGNQYKLKNLPKLSTVVINKIKKHIRTKLMHPHAYKFRLIWPKNWWPAGEDYSGDMFKTTSSSNDSSAKDATPVETSTVLSMTPDQEADVNDDEVEEEDVKEKSDLSAVKNSLSKWFTRTNDTSEETEENPEKKSAETHDRKYGAEMSSIRHAVSTNCLPLHTFTAVSSEEDGVMYCRGIAVPTLKVRSYSISDFRTTTLHEMWSDFLGAGHDICFLTHSTHHDDQQSPSHRPQSHRAQRFGWSMRAYSSGRRKLRDKLFSITNRIIKHAPHHASADGRQRRNSDSTQSDDARTSRRSVSDLSWNTEGLSSVPESEFGSYLSDYKASPSSHNEDSHEEHSKTSNLQRFGRRIMEARENIKTGITKQVERRRNVRRSVNGSHGSDETTANYSSEDNMEECGGTTSGTVHELDMSTGSVGAPTPKQSRTSTCESPKDHSIGASSRRSGSATTSAAPTSPAEERSHAPEPPVAPPTTSTASAPSTKRGMFHSGAKTKLGIMVGALSSVKSKWEARTGRHGGDANDDKDAEAENEAMLLAWQARAEAMKLAAESGEYPSLQSFLFTWKKDTQKRWIVLQSGVLSVYNTPEEQTANVGPRAAYPLAGCVCRPVEDQSLAFEVCVNVDGVNKWVQFWAENNIQARTWLMAVQQSAALKTPETDQTQQKEGNTEEKTSMEAPDDIVSSVEQE